MDQNNIVPIAPEQSSLHTVTPLSKYLALLLFILLPFLGGWVGYTYAPVKVVEVEKIVVEETKTQTQLPEATQATTTQETNAVPEYYPINENLVVDPKTVKVGDTFSNFIVTNVYYYSDEFPDSESYSITFSGEATISGKISPAGMVGPSIMLDEPSQNKLPIILLKNNSRKAEMIEMAGQLVDTLPREAIIDNENTKPYSITAEIKNYTAYYMPKGGISSAELTKIIDLRESE